MMFWTTQKVSPAGTLNKTDMKKWAYDSFIFLIPTFLFFVSQLQTALPSMHVPPWSMPLISYALAQLTALLKKFTQGK